MDIPVILTSAAVGATVAAVVSSTFTFVSQMLERRMRRDELLIKTATDLTVKYTETVVGGVKGSGKTVEVPPYAWMVYEYHRNLKHLMKYHKLPVDEQGKMEKYSKSIEESEAISNQ